MTRLAVCRKCRRVFFTNIKGNYRLRCPQRDCRSKNIMAWSARLLNRYGVEALKDLLPEQLQTIRTPPPKKEKKPSKPKTPGRKKAELKTGHIEYFHQRYRKYKERHPDKDPPHSMVRTWLQDSTGKSRSVCDRWAVELLENHKPKE